jgi:MFS family permease
MSRSPVFLSLRHRNARLFFSGLMVSSIGSWIQLTAMSILVYRLTGRSIDIGITVACQFLPMLLFGAWAGAIADRRNKRRMAIVTQAGMAAQALVLGALDLGGVVNLPIVYSMSLVLGVVNAFDNPARRGFVVELVEPHEIANAMSLNTAVMTGSRIFGPALAGILVDPIGTGWCFMINGLSFAAVLASMFAIDVSALYVSPRATKGGRPVRDALRYVRSDQRLFVVFLVLVVVSTFAFNYNVSLPKLADVRFGDEAFFGWLLSVTSIGSLAGSLLTASRAHVTMRWFLGSTLVLAVSGVAMSWSPHVAFAFVVAIPLGIGGAGFITSANSISQQYCPPDMRGRILALTAVAFLGSTPVGGPITGVVADTLGAEWGLAYGSFVSLAAVAAAVVWLRRAPVGSARAEVPPGENESIAAMVE